MRDDLNRLNQQLAAQLTDIVVTDPVLIGFVYAVSDQWQYDPQTHLQRVAGATALNAEQPVFGHQLGETDDQYAFATMLYNQLYTLRGSQQLEVSGLNEPNGSYFTEHQILVERFIALSSSYRLTLMAPNRLTFTLVH